MNKKLGYYKVGTQEFFSKIQAVLYAQKNNLDITWHFNDEVFSKFNWEVEPEETLDQLYDRRARELREQYDYIMLSYSGGVDSHNIVESFIRQNLHIDELIVVTHDRINASVASFTGTNTKAENLSAEHTLNTVPRLNEIKNKCPRTKITIRDMSDNLVEMLSNSTDGDWVLTKRETINPVGMARFDYRYISEVRKQFDSNKKIAILLGLEKPRTFIDPITNDFYMFFIDRGTTTVPIIDSMGEYANDIQVEFFYWDPSCVKMLCKQAHVVKKWLEVNPQYKYAWMNRAPTDILLVQEPLMRNIVYTTWNNNWFQVEKPILDFNSELSNGFFKEFKDSVILRKWQDGIRYLQENSSKFLREDSMGYKHFAKRYKIGKLCSINL